MSIVGHCRHDGGSGSGCNGDIRTSASLGADIAAAMALSARLFIFSHLF